ncbi:MAG TPA: kinase-associated lipoprotein B [Bacillaceae bacterium]
MELGQVVIAFHKTGKYIGEVTGVRPDVCTVRILAVLKHPMQGDLHNPKKVDVPFFHERKALAYLEQANIPSNMVRPFDEEIPAYSSSLIESVLDLYYELVSKQDDPFSQKSLEALKEIMKEYKYMYTIEWPNDLL